MHVAVFVERTGPFDAFAVEVMLVVFDVLWWRCVNLSWSRCIRSCYSIYSCGLLVMTMAAVTVELIGVAAVFDYLGVRAFTSTEARGLRSHSAATARDLCGRRCAVRAAEASRASGGLRIREFGVGTSNPG